MVGFGPLLRLALVRIMANRVLLATVALGVILASALMSTVILYTDAVRDLGLKHTLDDEDPLSLDVRIASSGHPASSEDYTRRRDYTINTLRGYLGGQLDGIRLAARSDTLYLAEEGQPLSDDDNRPRSHFQFVSGMSDRVDTVEGRDLGADETDPNVVEAWVSMDTAERLGVSVGDRFDLYPFWRTDNTFVTATVVGIVEPENPDDEYWRGRRDWYTEDTTRWPTYVFLLDEEAFITELARIVPDIDASYETFGLIDTGAITSSNAKSVEGAARGLAFVLKENLERTTVDTRLPDVLAEFSSRSFFTRVPLFALMIQVVGIVLYYLVMVSTMVVERQSGEIALLRARGATSGQIMTLFGLEAALICLVLGAAGPLFATIGISALGLTPAFDDLSGGNLLDVRLTPAAFVMGWAGALIAFVAMLFPAYHAARLSVVEHQRSVARPPKQPLFLRYYLDLVLIGAGALAFYQLRQQDSLVSERLFGGLSADPLLLISPTLFMLMVALAFLRLFPVALRVASWATRALPGPTLALGLWRMTRAPLHYSRLILLLLLATAIGMFAASFRATLDRSYDDRAAFEAGADGRVADIRQPTGLTNEEMADTVASVTGAGEATPLRRMNASFPTGPFRNEDLTILGVEPEEFVRLAAWRGDYAGPDLDKLLERLGEPLQGVRGAHVPAGVEFIGAWIETEVTRGEARPMVRLVDGEGRHFERELFPTISDEQGRRLYIGSLRANAPRGVTPPPPPERWLDSVFVRVMPTDSTVRTRLTMVVDDLLLLSGVPEGMDSEALASAVVLESFDSLDGYEWITGVSRNEAEGSLSPADTPGGGQGVRISFTRGPGTPGIVGARIASDNAPLPVLVEDALMDEQELSTGDEIRIYVNSQYVIARIVGTFELFPSHYPSETVNLLVTDLRSLQVAGTRVPFSGQDIEANEVWLGSLSSPIPPPEQLRPTGVYAEHTYDRAALRAAAASNPLVAASWEGILFLSFAAVLSLTALGFAVHARVSAASRGLEFAVLRSMGYTSRQVFSLVGFEQFFVLVLGVLAGTLLGFPLGRLMVGYLSRTETGAEPVPPLISEVSWAAATTVYIAISIVLAVTVAVLALLYSRLAVSRMLRVGEV